MLSFVLAVLAALGNATSSVLQRKANRDVPRSQNLSWRLIWSLLHQPVWFGGILAICIGFLLQATALGSGQLATVEPILVLELPLTLILASRVFGQGLRRREWGSAVVMTASLGGLLSLLSPSAGRNGHVPWYGWALGISVNLALVGALVMAGRRKSARGAGRANRAALLGIAAGSTARLPTLARPGCQPRPPAATPQRRLLPVPSIVLDISITLGKVNIIIHRGDRDNDEDLYAGSAGRLSDCPSQGPADHDQCAPDLGGDRPGRDPQAVRRLCAAHRQAPPVAQRRRVVCGQAAEPERGRRQRLRAGRGTACQPAEVRRGRAGNHRPADAGLPAQRQEPRDPQGRPQAAGVQD